MATPFEGFVLPSTPLLVGLLTGTVVVVAILVVLEPPITERFVLAIVPWVYTGAVLHVFYQIGEIYQVQIYPPVVETLFAAPAVYLTTFLGMGTIWIISLIIGSGMAARERTSQYLGGTGIGAATVMTVLVAWQSLDPAIDPVRIVVPMVSLLIAFGLTFVVYVALGAWRTYVMAEARLAGALVIFAHTFDGITTALGVDVLEVGERSTLPRLIMDLAADLPTEPYIGVGWLFVVVKVGVAVAIVWAFAEYIHERPTRGYLLFAVITLVGLGPAFNNLLLFFLGAGG